MAPLSVVRLLQMSAAVWDSRAKVEAISQQKKSIENKILNIIYTGTFTSFVFLHVSGKVVNIIFISTILSYECKESEQ